MSSLFKDNDGYRYILVVIDVFTRYLWVRSLKTKTAKEVEKAPKSIFEIKKPIKISTDGGGEFNNKVIEELLKKENIYHHITLNTDVKASYVERVIITLKRMMYRYFSENRSYRYLDVLQDLAKT